MGERERRCGRVLLIRPRESDKYAIESLDLLALSGPQMNGTLKMCALCAKIQKGSPSNRRAL